ncbi:hypothetical protein [Sphingomonas sp.]|uniref:hypothetical protein n=1 Tax=Sphingomonas sp. TaxID=28214 RepID=UPI003B004CA8
MLLHRFVLVTTICLTAASCGGSLFSDMPNMQDAASIRRTILKLNPVSPNGRPSDDGIYGTGQEGSDRSLFVNWAFRYAGDDAARQNNVDYRPAPLPPSVATAIQEEREYEAKQASRDLEQKRKVRAESAAEKALLQQAMLEDQIKSQKAYDEEFIKDKQEAEAQAAREAKFDECDRARLDANKVVQADDGGATFRSFKCEERFPAN